MINYNNFVQIKHAYTDFVKLHFNTETLFHKFDPEMSDFNTNTFISFALFFIS
jgi:hypothetical protein